MSQRALAAKADVSFRTIQLIEAGKHDARLSTIERIAKSMGYPSEIISRSIESIFSRSPDSVAVVSEHIVEDGEESWKTWLFDFVDAFREKGDAGYVEAPPDRRLSERTVALIASTAETLCDEMRLAHPWWCRAILPLSEPWFVSGIESLKASALAESPLHFRKRNIFVLENFLSRR